MKIALIVVGVLVLLVVIVAGVGYMLPQNHTASRERTYSADAARVFAAITTPGDYPAWRTGVKSVDLLPAVGGKPSFRETGSDGAITFVFDEITLPRRVVSRIADTTLAFGGKWTYELEPAGSGTRLRITEDGEVYNPVFRFLSRFVFGHTSGMETYLADLEKRLGG